MSSLTSSSNWQRERAIELDLAFQRVERRLRIERISLADAIKSVCDDLRHKALRFGDGVKEIKAGYTTVLANFYKWRAGHRTPNALLHNYKPGRVKIPSKLFTEFHRRTTMEGVVNISVAIKSLFDDWKAGKEIPGLGTWQQWWVETYPEIQLPEIAPEFPFSERSLYRLKPSQRERSIGNKGIAAGRAAGPYVSLNYSKLRKCELYTMDDVRLDILCIDEATGRAIEVICYIMMEVASRSIVAYVLKPAAHIKQEDVDELLAYGLSSWGIGVGYLTHLKLERGTVAMSDAAEKVIEAATIERDEKGNILQGIKIHRTGMDGGVRWIGSAQDKKSGHAAGKAVIESFNRKLHLMLMRLPGQRGNKFENQPANLGYESATRLTPGSLAAEAEKLARFEILGNRRVGLKLGMLYLRELEELVRAAIKNHNTEPGHDYQGHSTFTQREIAPKVWQDTDQPEGLAPRCASSPIVPTVTQVPISISELTVGRASTDLSEGRVIGVPNSEPLDTPIEQPRFDNSPSLSSVVKEKKTYVLKSTAAPAPTKGQYWAIWKHVEQLKPGLSRHAVTRKALGYVIEVKKMNEEELAKVISVFSAIIRDHK